MGWLDRLTSALIMGLFFMYRSLEYVIFTSYTLRPLRRVILYCNVGWCVKGSAVHRSRQQSLVACVKVTNTFVLHVR